MNIEDLVEKFSTTPFLFLGSGVTRRYYNLPDWKGLLEHFAREIKDDDFSYSSYENKASKMDNPVGLLPKVAELIQTDYDEKWFSDASIRTVSGETLDKIKAGLSPFKAEIASYIKSNCILENKYKEEIDMLSVLSETSISGVITTNYDEFVETFFNGYTKFVGQSQLIFSAIQGIAEIYKIHGSVEEPQSLVINEQDYVDFDKKSAYLAAKLMTIFMEFPIIFMGNSISDTNIQKIIKSIVECLDANQVKLLEDRFIFVEYQQGKIGSEVSPYTIMIDDKPLSMKKIVVDDFKLIYKALEGKKSKLPVRILRRFKQELYDFTVTNMPTARLRVASIEDERVADDELVMAIGKYSDYGLRGLHGLKTDEWYRNIVVNDIEFSADDLLEHAFTDLIKQNSGKLPVNRYLAEATKSYPECEELARKQDFDNLISNTIKRNRNKVSGYYSIKQIWDNEKESLERATRLIAHLTEEHMDVNELESVLLEIFDKDINILQNAKSPIRTNIRRLILIYDYLKWGK